VQGNLDPITLFAPEPILETRVKQVLVQAAGRAGHIFNLGHGIVPNTPVENVQAVVKMVKKLSPQFVRKESVPPVIGKLGEVPLG
jgi:uroporphyrinogen decarboxylase